MEDLKQIALVVVTLGIVSLVINDFNQLKGRKLFIRIAAIIVCGLSGYYIFNNYLGVMFGVASVKLGPLAYYALKDLSKTIGGKISSALASKFGSTNESKNDEDNMKGE